MSSNLTEDKVLEVALELTKLANPTANLGTTDERQAQVLATYRATVIAIVDAVRESRKTRPE